MYKGTPKWQIVVIVASVVPCSSLPFVYYSCRSMRYGEDDIKYTVYISMGFSLRSSLLMPFIDVILVKDALIKQFLARTLQTIEYHTFNISFTNN